MAWSKLLQPASFRGLVFDCLAIDDDFEPTIVEHRYPFVPGSDIEDMGRGARRIAVQAQFFGDDYEKVVTDFINALYVPGAGEFVHPVFGSLPTMQVVRGSIHHEADNVDQCFVNFELLETTAGNPFFTLVTANTQAEAVGTLSQAARDSSAGILSQIIAKVQALNPLSQLMQLKAIMNAPIALMNSLNSGTLVTVLDFVNFPMAWAGSMTALASGIINGGGISPGALLAGYSQAFGQLFNALAGSGSPASIGSSTSSTQAEAISAAQVHIAVELAASTCDAAATVLRFESKTATLSPASIETITNSARAQTKACIATVTATYPAQFAFPICEALKSMALAVQQAAQAIIVSRPPMISRQVITPVPLRLLAFRWYGDHTRAVELQRLNDLANPNFLQASDKLVAYAS